MKQYLLRICTLIFSFCSVPLFGLQQTPPAVDPFELLNSMKPEEIDEILDSLSKMSPEQIKYYEDLGKQMFKESGYDLDELEKSLAKPAPAPVAPKPVVVEPKPTSAVTPTATETESSKKEKSSLLRMVQQLSDALSSIRQKAATDETLNSILAPLHYDLDVLSAYINRLDYERHLKHFSEKEFTALKTKLRKMSLTLEELDINLTVPELNFTAQKSASTLKKEAAQKEQARSILEQFKSYMKTAFGPDTIIADIETLFKAYDKEALEIKKKIEDQQKKASEQIKKLPVTNTGIFAPIPRYTQPAAGKTQQGTSGSSGYSGSRPATTPVTPQTAGAQPAKPQQPLSPAEAKAKEELAKKEKEKGKETTKDKEMVEVPLTFEERVERLKAELRTVNVRIGQHKGDLLKIASDISNVSGTPPVSTPIIPQEAALDILDQQINHTFKELQENLTKFLKDVDAKDSKKMKQFKTDLKTIWSPTTLPELEQLKTEYAKASQVGLTGNSATNLLAQDAIKLMKKFMETYNAVNSKISSTRSSI